MAGHLEVAHITYIPLYGQGGFRRIIFLLHE
jgi:hypothetical protein